MLYQPHTLRLIVLVFAFATGCVHSTQAGLSNARAREWPQARSEKGYDVIANGDNSCARPGTGMSDPAPARLYACPDIERQAPQVAAAK